MSAPEEKADLKPAAVALRIDARPRDLGGFSVRRALPAAARRLVGPFIFFDHLGPATFEPAHGIDVRPHPHIGLATVTYLFAGEIFHRDSLGSAQAIRPGDVNWMVAGRGIVHSERSSPAVRADGGPVHGIQTWVALPDADEEMEPSFEHHPAATIPTVRLPGVELRVIAGTAYGARSPVGVRSPTLYAHARLDAGGELAIEEEHAERALYVVSGAVDCAGEDVPQGTMLVLEPGGRPVVRASATTDVMLIGGAPLGSARHIFWNFVSSTKERIERAKEDWRDQRFPRVPGDDRERIPLPP